MIVSSINAHRSRAHDRRLCWRVASSTTAVHYHPRQWRIHDLQTAAKSSAVGVPFPKGRDLEGKNSMLCLKMTTFGALWAAVLFTQKDFQLGNSTVACSQKANNAQRVVQRAHMQTAKTTNHATQIKNTKTSLIGLQSQIVGIICMFSFLVTPTSIG